MCLFYAGLFIRLWMVDGMVTALFTAPITVFAILIIASPTAYALSRTIPSQVTVHASRILKFLVSFDMKQLTRVAPAESWSRTVSPMIAYLRRSEDDEHTKIERHGGCCRHFSDKGYICILEIGCQEWITKQP